MQIFLTSAIINEDIMNSIIKNCVKVIHIMNCVTMNHIIKIYIFFWLSLPVHSGSLKMIDYPKQLSGPPSFF